MTQHTEVVVVGGGQAGLAAGYHLRRQNLDFVILDAEAAPGGAWQHMWDSLHLFSPAEHSSLPGRLMPAQPGETYPGAGHVVDYLTDYEKRYDLPVQHGTRVDAVRRDGNRLLIEANSGTWRAKAVISATGTWSRPFLPAVPGRSLFTGQQLHTVNYRCPADFAGQRVIVVGGGNCGAQIAADLALDGRVEVTWVRIPPVCAEDHIHRRADKGPPSLQTARVQTGTVPWCDARWAVCALGRPSSGIWPMTSWPMCRPCTACRCPHGPWAWCSWSSARWSPTPARTRPAPVC